MSEIYYSCIVPVYNESGRFDRGIAAIHHYLERAGHPYEIVIVDDGSEDDTLSLGEKFAEGKTNVKVISYKPNRGKGAAVKVGVMEAAGQYVFFSDIDLSVPIEYIEQFMPVLENGTDVVIGTRRTSDATIAVHQPWYREFLGEIFRRMVRAFFVPEVTDFTCGFKSFKADVAREVFKRSRITGWTFDAETIFIADKLGYHIKEIPVVWSNEEGTKVRVVRAAVNSLLELFRIKVNHWRGLYR